ncbi:HipA domain-containing protein [Arabiibacter massiliensis]|uniref:HipA domain-containing protein n=1 Tax=Arabiibacter massiliensis TaxID=1870985 RepID=UPI0009B96C1E|nr:HipA domain-containing protein [Arabiibacter massiliensis]
MEIADLRECPASGLFYGGRAGQKEGILVDGAPWIAKYPRTTRDLQGKHLPPYTSSPLSEYLGAHIYASLGVPVHETMLGYRNGKIVCACRDFTFPDKRLFEFKDIKNALSDDDGGFDSAPSDGESVFLGDVLATIETSSLLRRVPGVRERFWDMFVVDAFIKNPDRNNGNWGVLMDSSFNYELAPVYDLGSSLFSKRGDSLAERRMGDESDIEQDAFGTNVSCYRLPTLDGKSAAIHPFAYMAETVNPDLSAAIGRFLAAVDMDAIDALIDDVPPEAYGRPLISDAVRASHKLLLRRRLEEGFAPLA